MTRTHTTNYYNTFIQVADDCPVTTAEIPPQKGDQKTIATIQYEMIANNPYQYTSDDVVFGVFALRRNISQDEMNTEWEKFFAKGQPCLRSSPLAKRYGFGLHHDAEGKVALYPRESAEYEAFAHNNALKQLKAMRSKRS